jgi:hypothetical protein
MERVKKIFGLLNKNISLATVFIGYGLKNCRGFYPGFSFFRGNRHRLFKKILQNLPQFWRVSGLPNTHQPLSHSYYLF